MSDRQSSPGLGAVGVPPRRGAVDKGEGSRLRGSLQQREGALAGDLTERAARGVAIGLTRALGVTERAVFSGAEAVLERSLRAVVRGVGDRHRRQQDF